LIPVELEGTAGEVRRAGVPHQMFERVEVSCDGWSDNGEDSFLLFRDARSAVRNQIQCARKLTSVMAKLVSQIAEIANPNLMPLSSSFAFSDMLGPGPSDTGSRCVLGYLTKASADIIRRIGDLEKLLAGKSRASDGRCVSGLKDALIVAED
jgi:hypothetical protein